MSGSPLLEVNGLSKTFGGVEALKGLTLPPLQGGKKFGIVGPNGAGKTTLFNLLTGFLAPDSGTIRLMATEIAGLPPFRIARLGMGRLFQDGRVFSRLTALENVLASFTVDGDEHPLPAAFQSLTQPVRLAGCRREAVRLLEFVGLGGKKKVPGAELSFGEQKLLAIARVLACGAQILLLDEPVSGVHEGMRSRLTVLIRELALQGKGVVIIEHNLRWLLETLDGQGDFIIQMVRGEMEWFGSPEEARTARLVT